MVTSKCVDLIQINSSSISNNVTQCANLSARAYLVPTFNDVSLVKTVVLSVMFVVSLVGNTTTLVQMLRKRRRKSTINTLILHLVTADLIVTFFCNVTDAVWASTVQWYAGDAMCKLVKFVQVFGLYLSTYIIVIISIDRCIAIMDPMSRNKAPARVRVMIVLAWILSAVFSLPQMYIFRVMKAPFEEEFYQCVTKGAYTSAWQEPLYSCLAAIFTFLLPLTTMITAYLLIIYTINMKSKDFQHESDSKKSEGNNRRLVRGQLFHKAKVKSLRMTAVIVIAFIVCWTPYWILFIILTFSTVDDIEPRALLWIFFFGMANSMVNPIIYGAFHACKPKRFSRRLERPSLKCERLAHYYIERLRLPEGSSIQFDYAHNIFRPPNTNPRPLTRFHLNTRQVPKNE